MAEVVTTIKGDGAAPWIVIHAENAAESERLLTEALGGLLQTASEAGQLLTATVQTSKGLGNAAAPAQQAPAAWQNGAAPAQDWQQGQQPAQPAWQGQQGAPQAPPGFIGSANPEGKRCQLCGSVLVGKQPKVKRMWSCPNQSRPNDGHTVEWING